MKSLLNWEIDIDALPMGEEEKTPAGVETVILAPTIRPAAGQKVDIVEIKREDGGTERVVVGVEEGLHESDDDSDAGGFMVDVG